MTDTPNLALPYILAAQSQKHVTHNEAIRALDCLVQIAVLDRDLATPPSTPDEGARYIVAASATGAWTGATGKLAAFQDGAWEIYTPNEGWLAWIADENALVVYDGAGWSAVSTSGGGGTSDHGLLTGLGDDDHPHYHNDARGDARYTPITPSTLGINATADSTNRLSINSAASLFNNVGNGHQIKINKAAAGDTASFLFQTGFSGRAEIGTTGDDDFRFKVSPDGSTFHDAIVIDRNNGRVAFPKSSYREVLTANRTYYVRTDGNDSNSGLINSNTGAFLTIQGALNASAKIDYNGFAVTISVGAGTFVGAISIPVMVGQASTNDLVITGTGSTTIISRSASFRGAIEAFGVGARARLQNLRLENAATNGYNILAFGGGVIELGSGLEFGTLGAGGTHIVAQFDGFVNSDNQSISIASNANNMVWSLDAGKISFFNCTFTCGTRTFTTTINCSTLGYIQHNTCSYTGTISGKRYSAVLNGAIQTYGTTQPAGSTAGTTATGGVFA
ncbi:MAG: hypothetical protein CTY31_04575 [Hyphomicrobium sp.]|nr:MAG: hypothetical protein CTY31_04575 [Hyphomicrobium sp.]